MFCTHNARYLDAGIAPKVSQGLYDFVFVPYSSFHSEER
jgi:hypothetical protein